MVKQQMFSPGATGEEEKGRGSGKLYSTQSREYPARLRPRKIRRGQRGRKASGCHPCRAYIFHRARPARYTINTETSHVKRRDEDDGRNKERKKERKLEYEGRGASCSVVMAYLKFFRKNLFFFSLSNFINIYFE